VSGANSNALSNTKVPQPTIHRTFRKEGKEENRKGKKTYPFTVIATT
jgi:hypothetical protein